MMTSSQVVEKSVHVTSQSPSQDYTHPDDRNLPTCHILNRFKHLLSQLERMFLASKCEKVQFCSCPIVGAFPHFSNPHPPPCGVLYTLAEPTVKHLQLPKEKNDKCPGGDGHAWN